MLTMTTELPYRIILTVLLLGVLGKCADPTDLGENQQSDQQPQNSSSTSEDDESPPLSRSMPFYNRDFHRDYNNDRDYRDRDRDSYGYSSERNRDRGDSDRNRDRGDSDRNRDRGDRDSSISSLPSSIISSTSYSIKPGSGSESGSNVYMNTKPIPLIITADRGGAQNSNDYFSRYKGPTYYDNVPRRESSYYQSNTRDREDCYNGRNCPKASESTADEHRTYYSALNGNLKYPDRLWGSSTRLQQTGNRRNDDTGSEPVVYDRFASFPFRVRGVGPEKDKLYPEVDQEDQYKRRVTRTSTSSPGWVKLQPLSSHKVYDPFLPKHKESQGNSEGVEDQAKSDSQIANRIGMEISPESFAARWGWGSEQGTGSGSRLPSWLEEYNNKYEHRRPNNGPTRDEDTKNWVKLDPILVAGASISKWVPKGTSPSELPSTGNLIRDHTNLGSKYQPWWDRPEMTVPVIKKPSSHHGWGSHSQNTRLPSYNNKKRPDHGDSWKDVIYPDTPTSATASWVESSTGVKGAFSSSSSNGWKSDSMRRQPAVGSWTAPGNSGSNSHHRFNIRRPTSGSSSNYPDPHAGDDDPRWVLVSNTRRVTGQSNHYADRHRYRPSVDRWRDDLDLPDHDQQSLEQERDLFYGPHSHRLAKNVKFISDSEAAKNQEEAFRKINETLHTLRPVLNHRGNANTSSTPKPRPARTPGSTTTAKSIVKPPAKASFLSSILESGRKFMGSGTTTTTTPASTKKTVNGTKTVVNRRPHSMKPILAAVGAGMIPATMAAVLPMVMGKRKRRDAQNLQPLQTMEFKPVVVHNQLVFIPSGDFPRRSNFPTKNSHSLRQQGNGRSAFALNSIAR